MNHWIFVINDTKEEFENRMKSKNWPIFMHTPNRKSLCVGDHVVFYLAGREGQKFLGSAQINSEVKKTHRLDYFVELTNTEIWIKYVRIIELLTKLEFIKDKQVWGRFFQGGVRRISKKDFNVIIKKYQENS